MATTTKRRAEVKRADDGEAAQVVGDQVEALAREGACQMLMKALGKEVDAYLHTITRI